MLCFAALLGTAVLLGAEGQGAADTRSQATVPARSIFLSSEVVLRTDSADEEGIRGVTVVMRPQRGGKEIRLVTQRNGHFSKRGMPPGTYDVSIEGLQSGQKFAPIEFTVSGTSNDVFGPHLVVTD
ncbi:MAG: carboxypeptidase-like regulatory domain-containing protein [Gaiellales bacterium]